MAAEKADTRAVELLRQQRWAALSTIDAEGMPEGSMVAYAMSDDGGRLILHLSELASHTRNLLRQPNAALTISQFDSGEGDPQQLVRLSLSGRVMKLEPSAESYATARQRYLARLPEAEMLFDFADFHLFMFNIARGRFVGGFAQAHTLTAEKLRKAAQSGTD